MLTACPSHLQVPLWFHIRLPSKPQTNKNKTLILVRWAELSHPCLCWISGERPLTKWNTSQKISMKRPSENWSAMNWVVLATNLFALWSSCSANFQQTKMICLQKNCLFLLPCLPPGVKRSSFNCWEQESLQNPGNCNDMSSWNCASSTHATICLPPEQAPWIDFFRKRCLAIELMWHNLFSTNFNLKKSLNPTHKTLMPWLWHKQWRDPWVGASMHSFHWATFQLVSSLLGFAWLIVTVRQLLLSHLQQLLQITIVMTAFQNLSKGSFVTFFTTPFLSFLKQLEERSRRQWRRVVISFVSFCLFAIVDTKLHHQSCLPSTALKPNQGSQSCFVKFSGGTAFSSSVQCHMTKTWCRCFSFKVHFTLLNNTESFCSIHLESFPGLNTGSSGRFPNSHQEKSFLVQCTNLATAFKEERKTFLLLHALSCFLRSRSQD